MYLYNSASFALQCIIIASLFFIPGMMLRIILKKDNKKGIPLFVYLAEMIGLSISANVLVGTLLAAIGLFNIFWISVYILTTIIIYIIIRLKDSHKKKQNKNKEKKNKNHFFDFNRANNIPIIVRKTVFIVAIALSAMIILEIHTNYSGDFLSYSLQIEKKSVSGENYPLPYHGDEWTHIAQSKYILDNGKIPLHNPYFDDKTIPDKITGILESGFHVLVAEIFLLFPERMVLGYMFLPTIWIILTGLFMIYAMYRIFCVDDNSKLEKIKKNIPTTILHLLNVAPYVISSIAIITTAVLVNSPNLQGYWFFLPITVAISMMIFFAGICADENDKIILLILSSLSIIYFPIAIIAIGSRIFSSILTNLTDYSQKRSKSENTKKIIWILLAICLIAAAIIVIVYLKGLDFTKTSTYVLKHIAYTAEKFDPVDNYELFEILGIFGIFAAAGLVATMIAIVKNRKRFACNLRNIYFFMIVNIFSVLNWLLYNITGYSLIIRYQRNVLVAYVITAISAGVFLFLMMFFILRKTGDFGKTKQKNCNVACICVMITIIVVAIIFAANNSENVSSKNKLYRIIEKNDYDFLKSVQEKIGSNNTIIANPLLSMAVYPITGNHVIAISGGNLNYGNSRLVKDFAEANCTEKEKMMRNNHIDYIWITFEMDCGNFKSIFQKDYNGIYGLK